MSANPEWSLNLLHRSESIVEYVKRNANKYKGGLKGFVTSNSENKTISSDSLDTTATEGSSDSDTCDYAPLYDSLLGCVLVNTCEGLLVGSSIGFLVSMVPSLIKGRVRTALRAGFSLGNLRIGLFLALLMSINNGLLYVRCNKEKLLHPYFSSISEKRFKVLIGVLSGTSLTVLPRRIRRFLMFMLLTRTIEIAVRRRRRRSSPQVGISGNECVGLTMASMSVITTAWFGWPHLVPDNYRHFLESISGLKKDNIRDLGIVLRNGSNQVLPSMGGELIAKPSHTPYCTHLHGPDQTCFQCFKQMMFRGFVYKTIPFYVKLYQFPLLFSLLKNPKRFSPYLASGHFLKRVSRSALFLATLNSLAAGTICAMSRLTPFQRSILPMSGFVSGLSMYIEQPSRRLELALYVFGQALQILDNVYNNSPWTPKVPEFDLFVTSGCICFILSSFWAQHDYPEEYNSIIRTTYSGLMEKIIDSKRKRHTIALWNTCSAK